uniref:Synaptogyrin n=1 Tax=Trichuris muris TaxID=70415 RepID=A0A5S6QTF2_TRIMR
MLIIAMEPTGRAYGAGMAGGGFDPVKLVKTPRFILRVVCAIVAIIVFGTISSRGWFKKPEGRVICVFGESDGACTFSSGIGVLALLVCIGFGISDALFENISGVHTRRKIALADVGASGIFTFFWFVVFCLLVNKWSSTVLESSMAFVASPCRAAITFSFFSVFSWGGLAYLAWKRYQEGVENAFAPSYEQDFSASPYNYPTGYAEQPYQSSFPSVNQPGYAPPSGYEPPAASYQPPSY